MGSYLVTGAAGFIGSHLTERLLAEGHRVRAVDRFSSYYARDLKEANLAGCRTQPGFELIEADLADTDVGSLLAGMDGVFHLAAQPGVRPSWGEGFVEYVRDNLVATQRLFDALARCPIPAVVASSSSVYGDTQALPVSEEQVQLAPVSPYGLTKLTVEHLARIYIQQHGIHTVMMRYFTVYGPRQRPDMAFTRFLRAALAGETLEVLGDGSQSRDFSYVGDVVDATIRALAAPTGRVYNVGGGEPTSLQAVITTVGQLLERPLAIDRQPMAPGDVRHTWADTSRARQELGWEPRTSLQEGLAAQLAWLQGTTRCPPVVTRPDRSAHSVERRPRILTYSHDGFGLGHLRRNLRLVDALTTEVPAASAMMVTGCAASHYFRFPDNVDYVKLPSLTKVGNGRYVSRRLGLDGPSASRLRSAVAAAAAEEFEPDLVLVDHYPLGVGRELEETLRRIRADLPDTKIVLGWRDILDGPDQVRRNWVESGQIEAIDRLYDQVMIYGCQDLYDPVREYDLPASVAARTTFTGYLLDATAGGALTPGDERAVACVLGGGEDGRAVAWAFLEAMSHLTCHGWSGTLVTGPLMEAEAANALRDAASKLGVRCVGFVDDMAGFLSSTGVVVAMGGYNTVCEVLAAGTPAVIIPRVTPREEQLIRARRLAARGLVRVLHPTEATGAVVARAVTEQAELTRAEVRSRVSSSLDVGGLRAAATTLGAGLRERVTVPV